MTTLVKEPKKLTRQDFVSDQEVRWCPGCGDYAILAQMQKVLPDIGVSKENIVFISGIGCSSRFPYYMNTYGIHSIHGRAPTLASGLKAANPDLSVWVITGDGDALSIGGNHLIHAIRRNIDIKIILFNNRIYGLTKGQYSPTSLPGTKTKSTPMGSIEQPLNPISLALASEATFVARSVDVHGKHLQEVLMAAAAHKGTAFVEVFQNCLIFNDGAWSHVTDRAIKDDNIISLEHGKPLIFGKNLDKGIRMNGLYPEVVQLGNGVGEDELLAHDAHAESPYLAFLLSRLEPPRFPTPMGIFREVEKMSYSDGLMGQISAAQARQGTGDLRKLFFNAETWTVEEDSQIIESEILGTVIAGLDEEYVDEMDERAEDLSAVEHSLENAALSELGPSTPITVPSDASLASVIATMRAKNIGSTLVVNDKGQLVGVFTERDILNRVACQVEDLNAANVGQFMSPNPTTLHRDAPIAHALHLMALYGFRHLPLVDAENRPVGVVSFRDVVAYIERWFAP
ncbi:MAG TPA: thiamine pyrophosphate-dependent enzyme [Anaerolineales bacterium]|nr:thiamine pyrophosphate-dependent enzyme [Anaerolineales bacterium]